MCYKIPMKLGDAAVTITLGLSSGLAGAWMFSEASGRQSVHAYDGQARYRLLRTQRLEIVDERGDVFAVLATGKAPASAVSLTMTSRAAGSEHQTTISPFAISATSGDGDDAIIKADRVVISMISPNRKRGVIQVGRNVDVGEDPSHESATIEVRNDQGGTTLSANRLTLWDQDNNTRALLGTMPVGGDLNSPTLILLPKNRRDLATGIGVNPDGSGVVVVKDQTGVFSKTLEFGK